MRLAQLLDAAEAELTMPTTSTVADVKAKITISLGVSVRRMLLHVNVTDAAAGALSDTASLAEAGIADGTVVCVLRGPNCSFGPCSWSELPLLRCPVVGCDSERRT